jgi:hypothetical protein
MPTTKNLPNTARSPAPPLSSTAAPITPETFATDVATWLEPLLVGGLSAARTSEIGPTAARLSETILLGLRRTLEGSSAHRFCESDE